jgi:peptidoglycan/xylan/chitin deacetylase (PgdA/CDA1 family)
MKFIPFPCLLAAILFASCDTNPEVKAAQPAPAPVSIAPRPKETPVDTVMADAPTILERTQVPILCYHDIKEWRPNEKTSMKVYLVPVQRFKDQIKLLADSGYHSITPDQYYNYLAHGTPLPEKPVMFTFDDTDAEQYSIGAAELNKYGFKGVFFIMTISIGRPNYMSKEEIKALADSGHIIAAHTWDHHNVRQYKDEDWEKQLAQPKQKLEEITGKPVEYFAYPFGAWNKEAIPHIKKAGYKAAFQLTAKRDSAEPLYTIRRMLASGTYDAPALQKWMRSNF